MNALWITAALLVAGFAGWPVTALVFRLARTIDDKADAASEAGAAACRGPVSRCHRGHPAGGTAGRHGTNRGRRADHAAAAGRRRTLHQPAPPVPAQRILRGGAIIGVLERLGVCLAILTGQPVAIAYIVAIKGLGRFAELKETPVAAERFIIGTLTSMLWAAGIAAIVKVFFLS